MKSSYSMLFLVLSMLISASIQAANISVVPSGSNIILGSSISVDLVMSDLGNHAAPLLGAFDVDLNYDDNKFNLTDLSFGFSLGSLSLGEAISSSNTETSGIINLSEVSLLEQSASNCIFCIAPYLEDLQNGSVVLATLTFQSTNPGTAAFDLTINSVSDANGDSLTTSLTSPGAIQINAVPVPAAFWLFASSIPMLGFLKRVQNFKAQ